MKYNYIFYLLLLLMFNQVFSQTSRDYLELGTKCYNSGDYDCAVQYLTKAIQLDTTLQDAVYNLGVVYYDMREFALAEDCFTKAILLDSTDAALAFYYRGMSKNQLESNQFGASGIPDIRVALCIDQETIIKHCSDIITKEKSDTSYYLRSVIYDYLGLNNASIEDLTKAISINPKNHWYFCNRAGLFIRVGDIINAEEDIKQSLKLNPDFPPTLCNKAMLLFYESESSKAIDVLNRVISKNPDYGDAYLIRCMIYNSIEEFQKAYKDIKKAIQLKPDDDRLIELMQQIKEKL